ncbi:MAG: EI24 domain-containing protein [Pseudomonadota bacterium]
MILDDFFKAVRQLTDPAFLRVLALGLGLTLALFLAFYLGFVTVMGWILPDSLNLPWIGEITWIDTALSWASIPLMLVLSAFLMIPVASAFTGLFLDRIAAAVEARHYAHLPPGRDLGVIAGLGDGLKFLGVLIVANIAALVLYLLFSPAAPLIFWGLNGFLLGREYAQMVALRYHDAAGARAFRRRHSGTIFAAGVLMTIPLTIPVLNLLVPILGAATFTHLYHRISAPMSPSRTG